MNLMERDTRAAAVSLQRDEPFDRLNVGEVQKELARQGARFR